jgi:hypothetical protein
MQAPTFSVDYGKVWENGPLCLMSNRFATSAIGETYANGQSQNRTYDTRIFSLVSLFPCTTSSLVFQGFLESAVLYRTGTNRPVSRQIGTDLTTDKTTGIPGEARVEPGWLSPFDDLAPAAPPRRSLSGRREPPLPRRKGVWRLGRVRSRPELGTRPGAV